MTTATSPTASSRSSSSGASGSSLYSFRSFLRMLDWMHSEIDLIEADLSSERPIAARSSGG